MTRPYTRLLLATLFALAAVALLPGSPGAEDALPPRDPQTIAQTVVELDGQPVQWVVSLRDAAGGATAGDGRPALLLGASGRIALEGSSGRAILEPGEGYAVGHGGGVRMAAVGAGEGSAWVFDLVPPGSPILDDRVYTGGRFSPEAGTLQLVLVRDVLAPREVAPLPDSNEAIALLATDGIATVRTPGGQSFSLSPGSAAGVDPAATVTAGEGGATIVAAALLPADSPGSPSASPVAGSSAGAEGVIRLDLYACDPGSTPPRIPAGSCRRAADGAEFQVFELGSGDNRRGMKDAAVEEGHIAWTALPDGRYLLNALSLPDGYARFYVPGLQGINSPPERGYTAGPNEGYLLPLGPEQGRSWTLNVYLLPGAAESEEPVRGSADIVIRFRECPKGVVAEPVMAGRGCQPIAPPVSMTLDLVDPSGDAAFGWNDTEASDALTRTWRDVPAGSWELTGEMSDVYGFAVRSSDPLLDVALKPDKSAYDVTLPASGDAPAFLDIYLLQEP